MKKQQALLLGAALALTLALLPASASAFSPGSSSLHDPLFPQIGNGGYDVFDYAITLDYEPDSNALLPGTHTTVSAQSTQALSRFSLDFQRDLAISSVTVDGQQASYTRSDAKPRFSKNPNVTQPAKLVVTPAAGIPEGEQFVVDVAYTGVPRAIVDADESLEGWVQACSSAGHCDGSFTVNEPIGAQSWFPSNDVPSDKASVSTTITVPDGYTALGAGELASLTSAPGGGQTWSWAEDDPTATYLTTATVGLFDFTTDSLHDGRLGRDLPLFGAIDSAGSDATKAQVRRVTAKIPKMFDFLVGKLGPYPFDSIGYVADWVPSVGYALENQTKPHFAGNRIGPAVNQSELVHELSHQWMGDSVTGRTWQQIWFNEGWATFVEVLWDHRVGGDSPRRFLHKVLATDRSQFQLPPAALGTPVNLFNGFAVYNRPAAMLEGFREIVGNKRFFRFSRKLVADHGYATITERGFVGDALRASGLHRKRASKLRAYFRQWLHRSGKPKLTPADFTRRGHGKGGNRRAGSYPAPAEYLRDRSPRG